MTGRGAIGLGWFAVAVYRPPVGIDEIEMLAASPSRLSIADDPVAKLPLKISIERVFRMMRGSGRE